jgi:hypothetical protein
LQQFDPAEVEGLKRLLMRLERAAETLSERGERGSAAPADCHDTPRPD